MSESDAVVFVVDDDPAVRDALTSLLESVGLAVETFGSAQDFLTRQPPDGPGCPLTRGEWVGLATRAGHRPDNPADYLPHRLW